MSASDERKPKASRDRRQLAVLVLLGGDLLDDHTLHAEQPRPYPCPSHAVPASPPIQP